MCHTALPGEAEPSPAWPHPPGHPHPPQPPVHLHLCTPGQRGKGNPQERLASELLEEVCIP